MAHRSQLTAPHVTLHYAQTLDGRIATRTGHSQWISGEESLRLAHRLRAEHDAVLVGVGTVLADDPRLTVRLVPGTSPLRVIADSTLRLPLTANVLTDSAAPTVVATTERAPADRRQAIRDLGAEVLVTDAGEDGRLDLVALLCCLGRRDIRSVLIEGGAGLITAAFRARLVDRLVVCIAPRLVGAGVSAVGDLEIREMDHAIRFDRGSFTVVGDDLVFDGEMRDEK
jgi:5-amino-6-(5-phosphoribosylamino)uracil reductase/diaminohydroxyphosphoribosylaminopyrimidine deaminase/5-amino-6-(5-phosphoribosylamino)uracil reductase